jgi:hypothetical protein
MTEHTPTPWSLGSHNLRAVTKDAEGIADGYDAYMVAVASSHSLVGQAEAIANAAYIVKACNAFPDLVKALEAIKQATIDGRVCDDVAWFDNVTTLHDFCDEVLSRVKGAPDHG